MFDIAPSEFLLVAFVALVVIGPKDLPKAMRIVGYWVGKARGVGRQFRQGFDSMVREAELEEMEKRWAAENERIMREHPTPAAETADPSSPDPHTPEPHAGDQLTVDAIEGQTLVEYAPPPPPAAAATEEEAAPVMVERPVVAPADEGRPAPRPDGAAS